MNIYIYIYIYIYNHIFLIQSSVDGTQVASISWNIVNSGAMNIGVHVCFKLAFSVFLDIYPGVGLLDHMVVLFLVFLRNLHTVSQWLHQLTFSPTVYSGSLFSMFSPTFVICRLFDDSHSDRCEVIPCCGFDLHFSNN